MAPRKSAIKTPERRRAVLHRCPVDSGRRAHCNVHIKGTHRETPGTSTAAPILPWTKVPTCGGGGMVHAARGPMAHVCHDLRQARVPKALGDGGGRAWSTPPHLWQLFGFPLGSAQLGTPANIALFDKHLECLEKRPLNRLAAVCTATPLDVSKNSMQKPRTDIGIHHKFLDRLSDGGYPTLL